MLPKLFFFLIIYLSVMIHNILILMNKNAKIVNFNAINVHHMRYAQNVLIQLIMSSLIINALKNV